jgi:hypothetical protein
MRWVAENPDVYNNLNQISVLSYFRDKYLQEINRWVKNLELKDTKRKPGLPENQIKTSKVTIPSALLKDEENKLKIRIQLLFLKNIYSDKFAILYLPRNPVMKDFKLLVSDESEDKFNKTIVEICSELGIPVISMWKPFKNLYEREKVVASGYSNTVPGVGHLNKSGHRLIADSLVEFINNELKP